MTKPQDNYYPKAGWNERTNMTGWRFGKLTVIAYHSTEDVHTHREVYWIVQCDCGNYEVLERRQLRQSEPKDGHQCSECRHKQRGRSKSPVYQHWLRLMAKPEDVDEKMRDFELFRVAFERDYVTLKADLYGLEDDRLFIVKKDPTKPHSIANSYFSSEYDWKDAHKHRKVSREVIEELYTRGMTERQIAERIGANFETVHRVLQELGLKPKMDRKTYLETLRNKKKAKG